MEKEDETTTDYYMSINGTIGTTKDADFSLALYMNVKAMEDGGMQMNMGGTFAGESTGKTYGVDGDETSFDWDIAFHRYDIKTVSYTHLDVYKRQVIQQLHPMVDKVGEKML